MKESSILSNVTVVVYSFLGMEAKYSWISSSDNPR